VEYIYNGFDPDDFAKPSSCDLPLTRTADAFYRLAYIGTLWNLTDVDPLVRAIEHLAHLKPELARRLELIFAGRRTGLQDALLDRLESLPCKLVRLPYVDHGKAMQLLNSADALCVLLSNCPEAERVVPAKIFECMAARRPVLTIAPHGELWDIVARYPGGMRYLPTDIGGIANALSVEIDRTGSAERTDITRWDPSEFSRDRQSQILSDILLSIARGPEGPSGRVAGNAR
jgi:glycosyltransferase involved in cell wall biosynthesis